MVILSVAKNLFEENHFVGARPNLRCSTLPKIRQNDGKYGLNGLYLITSANHRIYRNREEIAVNLKKREEKTT